MSRIHHVVVVVPAADEEQSIGACLEAVGAARARLRQERPGVASDVVVVLDRTTDGTGAVVAEHGVHAVSTTDRCVGVARQVGTRRALELAGCKPEHVWTAHTDADSLVPDHWLVGQVTAAERGADLVLGTVLPALEGQMLAVWSSRHRDHDGHRHVHGANLGIGAAALTAAGGWPPLRSGEDEALVLAVQHLGLRIVRTGGLEVRTSARRDGRAPGGFSTYLRAVDAGDLGTGTPA